MNYQKVYMNQIYSSSLMGQVAQMWKDDILCDAVIKTGNVQTKAHRLVMIAACPVLQHMENASLGSHLEVRLSAEIRKDSVLAFLQYLYEGFMMLTEDNCKDIEKIGKLLHVDSVVKCCKDFFKCLGEKLGSSRPEKSTFNSSSEQPEFQHVRTTGLQKMVHESVYKRAGSEEGRPHSPSAKRKRTQRSVTPPSFSLLSSDDSHSRSREHGSSGLDALREDDTLEVVSSEYPERDEEGWPKQTNAPPIQKRTMAFSVSRPSTVEKDVRVVNISASATDSQPTAVSSNRNVAAAAPNSLNIREDISRGIHTDGSMSASPVQSHASKSSSFSLINSQGKSFAAGSVAQASASHRSGDQRIIGDSEHDISAVSGAMPKERDSPKIPDGKTGTGTAPDGGGSQNQGGPDMTIIKVEHPAEGLEMSVEDEVPQPMLYGMEEEGDNSSDIDGATGDLSRDNSLAEGDLSVAWQDNSYQGSPDNRRYQDRCSETANPTVSSLLSSSTLFTECSHLFSIPKESSALETNPLPKTPSSNAGAFQSKTCIQSSLEVRKPETASKSTSGDDVGHDIEQSEAIPNASVETDSTSNARSKSGEGNILNLLSKMDKKLSFLSKRVAAVEVSVGKEGEGAFSEYEQIYPEVEKNPRSVNVNSIPEEYRLTMKELEEIDETTTGNAGNFALKLVKRFFPELYGPDNQRFEYNWNGSLNKKTLDPVRKNVVRYYVSCLYPEVNDESFFRRFVIHAVNEGLRRPLRKKNRPPKREISTHRGNSQDNR